MTGTGILGKLPSHGDFLRRGVPSELAASLDAWLAVVVASSRDLLGDRWPAAWRAAPAWRFALAAGCCGPRAAAGVLVTSADRVGRCFPLLLVTMLPERAAPASPGNAAGWYDRLTVLALALRDGEMSAEAAGQVLSELPPARGDAVPEAGSLWWRSCPARAEAYPDLPGPAAFAAMLDGRLGPAEVRA